MKSYIIVTAFLLIIGCVPYPIQGVINNINANSDINASIVRFNYNFYKERVIMLIGVSVQTDQTKDESPIDLSKIIISSAKKNSYVITSINFNGKNFDVRNDPIPFTLKTSPGNTYNIEYVVESKNKMSKREFTERVGSDTLKISIHEGQDIGMCWFSKKLSPM